MRADYPNHLDYRGHAQEGMYFAPRLRLGDRHNGDKRKKETSPTGNRTRVAWVKTTYPDQLDYRGQHGVRRFGRRTVAVPGAQIHERFGKNDWSGIRTHASEETSALNWRLRPLGHPTAHKDARYVGDEDGTQWTRLTKPGTKNPP